MRRLKRKKMAKNDVKVYKTHCWKGNQDDAEEKFGFLSDEWYDANLHSGTCLLPDGHDGNHVFTPDSEICVSFNGEED